jgi:aminoglycoside/choline kinase family phosphotransferase
MKKAAKPEEKDQRDRFIEAARKAGASEDEAEFDRAIKKVAKAKPKDEKPR